MKKAVLLVAFIFTVFSFKGFAVEKKEPLFLTAINGTITDYLATALPTVRVTDVWRVSNVYTAGSIYIMKNYKNLAEFIVDIETQNINDLKGVIKSKCAKYRYFALDNCRTTLTSFNDILAVKTTCNAICLDD